MTELVHTRPLRTQATVVPALLMAVGIVIAAPSGFGAFWFMISVSWTKFAGFRRMRESSVRPVTSGVSLRWPVDHGR